MRILPVIFWASALSVFAIDAPAPLVFSNVTEHAFTVFWPEVSSATGYELGIATNGNTVFSRIRTTGTEYRVKDLAPAEYLVTLQALGAGGDVSSSVLGFVNLISPPMCVMTAPLPLSEYLADGCYAEVFSICGDVTRSTTWYDGRWPVWYWHAYLGGERVTLVRPVSERTTYSGMYAASGLLGGRPNGEAALEFGVTCVNDTELPLSGFAVSFTAVQWGWRNESAETLFCECRKSGASTWQQISALSFTTPRTASSGEEVSLEQAKSTKLGLVLEPGESLSLRFRMDAQTNAAGLGLRDFRLTFHRAPGLVVVVR